MCANGRDSMWNRVSSMEGFSTHFPQERSEGNGNRYTEFGLGPQFGIGMSSLVMFNWSRGMPMSQVNGQRISGPPVGYTGPPPPKGSEIFVGKLPRDCFEYEFLPLFEKAGRIYKVRLMMDFSGTNRGYCFIQYFTPREAAYAIEQLNGVQIRPMMRLGVKESVDNSRLFITGFDMSISVTEAMEEMKRIAEGVVGLSLGSYNPKIGGTAFVQFESHRAAQMARRKLLSTNVRIRGNPITVDWARPMTMRSLRY